MRICQHSIRGIAAYGKFIFRAPTLQRADCHFGSWIFSALLLASSAAGQQPTNLGAASEVLGETTSSTVDFERHVAPLLGRLGCNSAACHGAFGGKGGLQLSLFGYSSKMDFEGLRDYVDTDDAASSLMLLKPTGAEEHEGGIRFAIESSAYQTIRRWIEGGAHWTPDSGRVDRLIVEPNEIAFDALDGRQALSVTAVFGDGSTELVTAYCQFSSRDEGIASVGFSGEVQPVRTGDTSVTVSYRNEFATVSVLIPAPGPPANNITHSDNAVDVHVLAKLNQLNIRVSPRSSDAEFLRRIMIDTLGTIPLPDEIRQFCEDARTDKRERKIDELLAHPSHAALWATRMCDITKCDMDQMTEVGAMRGRRAQMWHDWFRRRFADNEPYDRIVQRILTATSRGELSVDEWIEQEESLIRQGRASFETDYANRDHFDVYWRRIGDDGNLPIQELAELTAAAFTGVRLNCAQCHKHPFDRWTQDDYAAFANIFSHVVYGSSTELNIAVLKELDQRRSAKRAGNEVSALPKLREVFLSDTLGRELFGSDPGVRIRPRALGGPPMATELDWRAQLFNWLVDEDNPYFARSFSNRVWAVYFGVGLVDPVDDFSVANPPSHPELLDELARAFRASGFDIRALERLILTSETYQRSSAPNESNRWDTRNFARQYIRPLLAEVAFDCVHKALGARSHFGDEAPADALAIEVGANQLTGDAGRILQILGRGERSSVCDCDRRDEQDLRQFIFMMNDRTIHQYLGDGAILQLAELPDEPLAEELYLRMLGRMPTSNEIQIVNSHLAASESRERAFSDLVWALLNSREFITNH